MFSGSIHQSANEPHDQSTDHRHAAATRVAHTRDTAAARGRHACNVQHAKILYMYNRPSEAQRIGDGVPQRLDAGLATQLLDEEIIVAVFCIRICLSNPCPHSTKCDERRPEEHP